MNRYNRGGLFALAAVGGYFLWRNRSQVQQFLESRGIRTPLDTSGNLTDTIRSGVSKLRGKSEHAVDQMDESARKAI